MSKYISPFIFVSLVSGSMASVNVTQVSDVSGNPSDRFCNLYTVGVENPLKVLGTREAVVTKIEERQRMLFDNDPVHITNQLLAELVKNSMPKPVVIDTDQLMVESAENS